MAAPKKKKLQLSKVEEAKVVELLVQETHFTKLEVETLIKKYKILRKGPCIEKATFIDLLHNTFGMTEEYFMERVFITVDKDKDGYISIEEWVRYLSVILRGTLEERIRFCFSVYDINEDLQLSREEMANLLKLAILPQPGEEDPEDAVLDLVEIILKKLDVDHDGRLSYEDYKISVEEEPLLLEAFGTCLPDERAQATFLAVFSETHPLLK